MVIETDGAFRTKDMTEAALLSSQDFSYSMEKHGEVVWWVFEINDENAEDVENITLSYAERSARVEPREFMSHVARIRNELYKYLGMQPKRVTAPSSQS